MITEREARLRIRDLEANNRAKAARIAYLETQLANAIEENTMLKASKKRKKISKLTGNEKLTSFAAILGT